MQTALEALKKYEEDTLASDGPKEFFYGKFKENWIGSERRARLVGVLARLNDLNVQNVQMWGNYETAVTFAGDGKALWMSYTGHAFHIWTNFGESEEAFTMSNNIILEDGGGLDNRSTVVQVVRDYFRPGLVEAA
jgi:hypothetical protein